MLYSVTSPAAAAATRAATTSIVDGSFALRDSLSFDIEISPFLSHSLANSSEFCSCFLNDTEARTIKYPEGVLFGKPACSSCMGTRLTAICEQQRPRGSHSSVQVQRQETQFYQPYNRLQQHQHQGQLHETYNAYHNRRPFPINSPAQIQLYGPPDELRPPLSPPPPPPPPTSPPTRPPPGDFLAHFDYGHGNSRNNSTDDFNEDLQSPEQQSFSPLTSHPFHSQPPSPAGPFFANQQLPQYQELNNNPHIPPTDHSGFATSSSAYNYPIFPRPLWPGHNPYTMPTEFIDLTGSSPIREAPPRSHRSIPSNVIDVDSLPDRARSPDAPLFLPRSRPRSPPQFPLFTNPGRSNSWVTASHPYARQTTSNRTLPPPRRPPPYGHSDNSLAPSMVGSSRRRPEDPVLGTGGRVGQLFPPGSAQTEFYNALFHPNGILGGYGGIGTAPPVTNQNVRLRGPLHHHHHHHHIPHRMPAQGGAPGFNPPGMLNYTDQPGIFRTDDTIDHAAIRNADYKAPQPAREGFTRSPLEDDLLLCAACDQELGADSPLDKGDEVWSGKCGHVSIPSSTPPKYLYISHHQKSCLTRKQTVLLWRLCLCLPHNSKKGKGTGGESYTAETVRRCGLQAEFEHENRHVQTAHIGRQQQARASTFFDASAMTVRLRLTLPRLISELVLGPTYLRNPYSLCNFSTAARDCSILLPRTRRVAR